jgi:predicted small metal-binding protein
MVVMCECGWMSRGDEDCVVEAMQVHVRQIHGRELTKAQVLAKAQASEGQD